MTIAVDFDGTIVRHRYPKIGEEIPFATDTLRMLISERHRLILWTVREGRLLDEAIEWCKALTSSSTIATSEACPTGGRSITAYVQAKPSRAIGHT